MAEEKKTFTHAELMAMGVPDFEIKRMQERGEVAPPPPAVAPPPPPVAPSPAEPTPSVEVAPEPKPVPAFDPASAMRLPEGYEYSDRPDDVFVKMASEGASVGELTEYARENPTAVRGAYASRLARELDVQLVGVSDLEGEEQFDRYVELGFVPEGSEYVAPAVEGEAWSYRPPVSEIAPVTYEVPLGATLAKAELTMLREEHPEVYATFEEEGITGAFRQHGDVIARVRQELALAQWAETLKTESPKLHAIYQEGGEEAYDEAVGQQPVVLANLAEYETETGYDLARAIREGKIEDIREGERLGLFDSMAVLEAQSFAVGKNQLPGGQWMEISELNAIKAKSPRAYEILTTQGHGAYVTSLEEAREILSSYKSKRADQPDAYNIKQALMTRKSEVQEAIELLFDATTLEALYDKYYFLEPGYEPTVREREEVTPETTKVMGVKMSPALAGVMTAAGGIAIAEPTPIGELILLAVLGGIAAYTAYKTSRGESILPEVKEVAEEFKAQEGREITTNDISTTVDFTAARVVTPVATIPSKMVSPEVARMEVPPFRPAVIPVEVPPFRPAVVEPIDTRLVPPRIEPLEERLIPPKVEVEVPPLIPPKIDTPQIMVEVAVAEEELVETVIRPKILSPSELDALWVGPEESLIRLDTAVTEAAQRGEITDEEVQAYHTAKRRYLSKKQLLHLAMQTHISNMQPQLINQTLAEAATIAVNAYLQAVKSLTTLATQAATQAYTQAIAEGKTVTEARTATQTVAQNAIREATQSTIQTAVQTATQVATQTLTQTVIQTLTSTAVQAAVHSAVRTGVNSITAEMTQTATNTATGPPPRPRLPGVAARVERERITAGSILWLQGFDWKYIPPPYDQARPISLGRTPPLGAKIGGRTPQETLQIVGQPRASVPDKVAIDLGIMDIVIHRGRDIEFRSGGAETDVGTTLPSPTTGMSVVEGDSLLEIDDTTLGVPATQDRKRRKISKKKARKDRFDNPLDRWLGRLDQ